MQRVRLTKKLAPILNGVDLSRVEVGDECIVPESAAAMLIREGWAVLAAPPAGSITSPISDADTEDRNR